MDENSASFEKEAVMQAEQYLKESHFDKSGPLQKRDEEKAVKEAERTLGLEAHIANSESDKTLTPELMEELYKTFHPPTEGELATAAAAKIIADTKEVGDLNQSLGEVWGLMCRDFHEQRTDPNKLNEWLSLQQKIAESNRKRHPEKDFEFKALADFHAHIITGDNLIKVGYCDVLAAEALKKAGELALQNNPKFKDEKETSQIWQNMSKAWENLPEQNR